MYCSPFLTTSDGEVNKNGKETLCETYLNHHVSDRFFVRAGSLGDWVNPVPWRACEQAILSAILDIYVHCSFSKQLQLLL